MTHGEDGSLGDDGMTDRQPEIIICFKFRLSPSLALTLDDRIRTAHRQFRRFFTLNLVNAHWFLSKKHSELSN